MSVWHCLKRQKQTVIWSSTSSDLATPTNLHIFKYNSDSLLYHQGKSDFLYFFLLMLYSFIINTSGIYSLLLNLISKTQKQTNEWTFSMFALVQYCSEATRCHTKICELLRACCLRTNGYQTFPLCCYAAVDCNQVQIQGTWTLLEYFHFMLHYRVQIHLFDSFSCFFFLHILHIKTYDECIKYDASLTLKLTNVLYNSTCNKT